MATNDTPTVEISRPPAETILVPIVGDTPLIVHRFSEKAKRQMLDAMQGRKTPKTPKDPDSEFKSSLYRCSDGRYGFPALAFKAATIGGARFYGKDVTMASLRQMLFFSGVPGDDGQIMTPVEGDPSMREDVVRVGQGTDLRYRGEFMPWRTELRVTYVSSIITQGSVLSLIDAGGMGVGVGEWRPEKRGMNGTYHVDTERDITVISGGN